MLLLNIGQLLTIRAPSATGAPVVPHPIRNSLVVITPGSRQLAVTEVSESLWDKAVVKRTFASFEAA